MIKKHKILLIVLLFSNFSFFSFAQISDRSNDEDTYIMGARPQAGDIGIYLGVSTDDIANVVKAIDSDTSWQEVGIPLINIKYYYTDKLVFKAGARVYKRRRSIEGDVSPLDNSQFSDIGIKTYEHKEVDAQWNLYLGAEKHFDLSNIYDWYVGAQANIGYNRSVRTNNITYDTSWGGFSNYFNDEGSSFGIVYGLEGLVGVNFFLYDFPVACGLEYGFSARNFGANRYKYEYSESINGTSASGTYYTSLIEDFENATANSMATSNTRFSDLKAKRFDITPIARVTITWYIRR
ncbi:MAG: hypothetical protein VX347_01645 [Bacteroidota bacterium]|nr:hypothetical protein [Bacteroidota bacterium]